VPEDRFGDLGADRPKSAAERFQELDERDPEPQDRKPGPPRPAGARYGWVIGIAFVIVIGVGLINLIPNQGAGYRGVPAGEPLPDFATPVVGGADKDANLQQEEANGVPAACAVQLPEVLNICDLRRERPIVMTFVANATRGCEAQLDRVERVWRSFPAIAFVGVISKRDQPEAEDIVKKHRWGFTIALDRDAQLFNAYGIGDCPTTVFAFKGGKVLNSRRGGLSEPDLRAQARALTR
jgi:AhpC/TSA family protein